MINRLIYFTYYVKKLDWKLFNRFQKYLVNHHNIKLVTQILNIILDSFIFNVSILEYYQFKFYKKTRIEKFKWAGTGYMYEYQKIMNPVKSRIILDDKREFYVYYKNFFRHKVFSLSELVENPEKLKGLLENTKLVFKASNGKCGKSVQVIETKELLQIDVIEFMKKNKFDMVETFIFQHTNMDRLSPSGVNTIRIFTQLDSKNNVEILGCRLRISIDSHVDNLAAGNAAAAVDENTGIIYLPAVFSDITKEPISVHPITKCEIVGFQVPYWKECVELVKEAAILYPQNRSIGWDIVITENGPGLIEGNHDWCKLLWQLPVNQGLKHLLKIS